jgi:hypothetical protein
MQEPSSTSTPETSSNTAKKAAIEAARADIRAVIAERRKRIRETADNGEPPYLDTADALPAIAEARGLSQGEVNQLTGSEVAADLSPEFAVDNRKVQLPPNPGGAKTAASFKRVKQDQTPDLKAGLDDPEPES